MRRKEWKNLVLWLEQGFQKAGRLDFYLLSRAVVSRTSRRHEKKYYFYLEKQENKLY